MKFELGLPGELEFLKSLPFPSLKAVGIDFSLVSLDIQSDVMQLSSTAKFTDMMGNQDFYRAQAPWIEPFSRQDRSDFMFGVRISEWTIKSAMELLMAKGLLKYDITAAMIPKWVYDRFPGFHFRTSWLWALLPHANLGNAEMSVEVSATSVPTIKIVDNVLELTADLELGFSKFYYPWLMAPKAKSFIIGLAFPSVKIAARLKTESAVLKMQIEVKDLAPAYVRRNPKKHHVAVPLLEASFPIFKSIIQHVGTPLVNDILQHGIALGPAKFFKLAQTSLKFQAGAISFLANFELQNVDSWLQDLKNPLETVMRRVVLDLAAHGVDLR